MTKGLSEETKYELKLFGRELDRDLTNLMDLLRKQNKDNKPILYVGRHIQKIILPVEEYQKMCQRLEQIDNANPSEALKCLIGLEKEITQRDGYISNFLKIKFDIIKQSLIKAQEQEKVLEIIKNKKVKIDLLYASSGVEQYNDELVRVYGMWFVKDRQLTEEDFDTLKRCFKNE